LKNGHIAGDDTDSHIDTLARFCTESVIAYVTCTDSSDEHYQPLAQMEHELKAFVQENGKPYELIPLPMAKPIFLGKKRLPATYANFLVMNEAVLVPSYNTSNDEQALNQLKKAFPNREIIGIDCTVLAQQHGSLHCITMQYPAGTVK
jgi:agmatine/peptidylarginine deiminase